MRLALAQINPIVGDLDGNRALILERLEDAKHANADFVVFPELAVTGYPPEDCCCGPGSSVRRRDRSSRSRSPPAGSSSSSARPTSTVISTTRVRCVRRRGEGDGQEALPPDYGVFDEMRYFAPGNELFLFEHGEALVGVTVCEDMWQPGPPSSDLALAGAELIVNISASPFHLLRDREREEMFRTRARDNSAYVAFCNTVGGQDELIFDGHSLILDDEGAVLARAPGSRRRCSSSTSIPRRCARAG